MYVICCNQYFRFHHFLTVDHLLLIQIQNMLRTLEAVFVFYTVTKFPLLISA